MMEVKAIIRIERLGDVVHAIQHVHGASGITVSMVEGIGREEPPRAESRGFGRVMMAKIETVVEREIAEDVVAAIVKVGNTGRAGDGKVFMSTVERVVDVRHGPTHDAASAPKEDQ